jgi:hypothetical protein
MAMRVTKAKKINEKNLDNVQKNEKNRYNVKEDNIKKMIAYLKIQNKNDTRTN